MDKQIQIGDVPKASKTINPNIKIAGIHVCSSIPNMFFLIGVDISVDPSSKRIIRIPEFKAPHINFLFIDISSPLKYA